jgi:hypothetical protein
MGQGNGRSTLEIVYFSPGELTPYFRNPRKKKKAVEKVAASLEAFGWRQPIVCDESLTVIVGHTRLEAAKRLRLSSVPVHIARDLGEEEARAYRIADNRTNEEAGWDVELLALELTELGGFTGFEDGELDSLLGTLPDAGTWGDAFGALPDSDRPPFQGRTFTLHDEQIVTVEAALARSKALGPFVDSPNENSNGNALARICETFLTLVPEAANG